MADHAAPRRVRLTVDLTKYDTRCKPGECGTTTTSASGWAALDTYADVIFDNGAHLPVLFRSLDVEDV